MKPINFLDMIYNQLYSNFPYLLNGKKISSGVELQALIKLLADHFHPDKIVCFGCIHANITSENCFAPKLKDTFSHYFLLVTIRETSRREHEMQHFADTHFKDTGVTILCHSTAGVKEAIGKQSRFFNTVWQTGTIMYSSTGILQLEKGVHVDPLTTLAKAEAHFNNRFALSKGFLESAEARFIDGNFNLCVFLLHQVVEQACIAMIRTFMGYHADIHHLGRLLTLCLCFSETPNNIFPRHIEEENHLFQVLLRSYSEARYRDEFKVIQEDARLLLFRSRKFLNIAENLCLEKIKEFKASIQAADLPILL
jgi:HEPN domain-containing protein